MEYTKEKFEDAKENLKKAEDLDAELKDYREGEPNPLLKFFPYYLSAIMKIGSRVFEQTPFVIEARTKIKKLYAVAEKEAKLLEEEHERLIAEVKSSGENFVKKAEELRKFEEQKLGMKIDLNKE